MIEAKGERKARDVMEVKGVMELWDVMEAMGEGCNESYWSGM